MYQIADETAWGERMVLGIIPARGGSKGIPRKNIKNICGKPLIAWSIEKANKATLLDDFIVSTEDREISDIAELFGARVLRRPKKLSLDDTDTLLVLQHVVNEMNPDAVVLLQPTSPIRDDDLIDRCIARYFESGSDNLATGFYCKSKEFGTYDALRRQDIDGFFYDDGNVYIFKKELLLAGRWSGDEIERYVISREQNFEIDDELDFFLVEKILEKRLQQKRQKKCINVEALVMDVDGVWTDGGMYYSESGDELKKFNTRDGKGIELLRNRGIKTAIITQENTEIVANRAKKLRIDYVYQGVTDKLKAVLEIAKKMEIELKQIAYVGDDINDVEAMRAVGFSATPADGADENKRVADCICSRKGGEGCVREICDLILRALSPIEII